MLYNANKMSFVVRVDNILNQKKYTNVECFQLSALLENIIWTETSFHAYVSAVVGSQLFTEILLILILKRARKRDSPST